MSVDPDTLDLPGFPGPLYAQVAAYLRRKISAAEWSRGGAIPNETSLAKDIGVSVGTVRKALEILEREQLIERRQGRGTFVLEASEANDVARFSRLTVDGQPARMHVVRIDTETGEADQAEAGRLSMRIDDPVIRLNIHWRSSGGMQAAERLVVAAHRFPGLEQLRTMSSPFLFALYRTRYQIVVSLVQERVSVVAAGRDHADLMAIDRGDPLLVIDRVASASGIGAIEWSTRHLTLGAATYNVRMS